MSAIPITPVGPSASSLPESAKISVDSRHDASAHFAAHQVENGLKPVAAPVTPIVPVTPQAVPAAEIPPIPTPVADPASQLSQRYVPESAKAPIVPVAPVIPASDPTAALNPEDKLELPPNYSANARQSFDGIKAVAKDLRIQMVSKDTELTRLRGELEQLRTGGDASELERLRTQTTSLQAENENMSKRLMVVDLQSHPRFQSEIIAPRQQALGEAKTILDAQNLNADLESLIARDDVSFRAGLSEIVAKLPTALDQADFATAIRSARGLKLRADQAITNAKDTSTALRQQSTQAQQVAFDGAWRSTIGSMQGFSELAIDPTAPAEARTLVEQFNAGFRNIGPAARKLALEASSSDQVSRAAIKAAAYDWQATHVLPLMSRAISAKDARIAELELQINGIRSRNPNAQMRGQVGPSDASLDPNKMDHRQAAEFFASRRSG